MLKILVLFLKFKKKNVVMVVMTVGGEMRIAILDKITGEWAQQ